LSVRVQLPPVLRAVAGGERIVKAHGGTIGEVLADLTKRNAALALHIFDEAGAIRRNIVFLHDGSAIRARDAHAHPLKPDDELVVTNALAGG
jgi:molybdopterin converting factor small subunit